MGSDVAASPWLPVCHLAAMLSVVVYPVHSQCSVGTLTLCRVHSHCTSNCTQVWVQCAVHVPVHLHCTKVDSAVTRTKFNLHSTTTRLFLKLDFRDSQNCSSFSENISTTDRHSTKIVSYEKVQRLLDGEVDIQDFTRIKKLIKPTEF